MADRIYDLIDSNQIDVSNDVFSFYLKKKFHKKYRAMALNVEKLSNKILVKKLKVIILNKNLNQHLIVAELS